MRTIQRRTIGNLWVLLLLFTNCSEKKEDTDITKTEAYRTYVDSRYRDYEKRVNTANKTLVMDLFDSIAYSSLDLILEKRAYASNPDNRPNLRRYTLDKMERALLDQSDDIDSIKIYIDRFKMLRTPLLRDRLSKSEFQQVTDTLLGAKLYRDSIIKSKDSLYITHINILKNKVTAWQDVFEDPLPMKQWEEEKGTALQKAYQTQLSEKNEEGDGFFVQLKGKSTLLFWCLIGSILMNLVLIIFLFKNRDENDMLDNDVTIPPNTKEAPKQTTPVLLAKEKVAFIVKNEFDHFKKSFEKKFLKDCAATQETKFGALEDTLLEDCNDQDFKDGPTLKKYIQKFVNAKRSALEEDIKKYVTKTMAIQEIDTAITAEKVIADFSSDLISDEEIRLKVNQYKKNAFDELPQVKLKSELHRDILNLKKEIHAFINHRIKENSQLYFPFTDTNGTVMDNKKSKERERDSALKLSLHPDDTSKASFQLLYDYTEMMLGGIQSYDVLLMPICHLKGENFNRNGTRIQQLADDGEMILENGQWRVTKKLDIKII